MIYNIYSESLNQQHSYNPSILLHDYNLHHAYSKYYIYKQIDQYIHQEQKCLCSCPSSSNSMAYHDVSQYHKFEYWC